MAQGSHLQTLIWGDFLYVEYPPRTLKITKIYHSKFNNNLQGSVDSALLVLKLPNMWLPFLISMELAGLCHLLLKQKYNHAIEQWALWIMRKWNLQKHVRTWAEGEAAGNLAANLPHNSETGVAVARRWEAVGALVLFAHSKVSSRGSQMARHTKQEFFQQASSPGAPLLTPVSAQGMAG